MAAQKFTRKELKQDAFVTRTQQTVDFIQKNATAVGVGLLVLVVVLVGGSYVRQGQNAARVEASYLLYHGQNLLGQGAYDLAIAPLQECIDRHGQTDFGRFARVGMVSALLGLGEVDNALARIDLYRTELKVGHPARQDLDRVYAYALADAGRHEEAAAALAQLPTAGLADVAVYERQLQQSRWLQTAGNHADAVRLLEDLQRRVLAGELEIPASDIEQRLATARALRP